MNPSPTPSFASPSASLTPTESPEPQGGSDVDAWQPPSRSVGVEAARSLALMLVAACLTALVLTTQRLMPDVAAPDQFLGWAVVWCVMLAGLVVVSRLANALVTALLSSLDAWAWRLARHRASRRQRLQVR